MKGFATLWFIVVVLISFAYFDKPHWSQDSNGEYTIYNR
jgi:hypothetical protein